MILVEFWGVNRGDLIKLANAMGDPSLQYKLYEIYEENKDK